MERRLLERNKVATTVYLSVPGGRFHRCRARNLSAMGVFLEIKALGPAGRHRRQPRVRREPRRHDPAASPQGRARARFGARRRSHDAGPVAAATERLTDSQRSWHRDASERVLERARLREHLDVAPRRRRPIVVLKSRLAGRRNGFVAVPRASVDRNGRQTRGAQLRDRGRALAQRARCRAPPSARNVRCSACTRARSRAACRPASAGSSAASSTSAPACLRTAGRSPCANNVSPTNAACASAKW